MFSDVVLQLDPSEDNPRNSEGAFVTLADGRILFAYTRFRGGAGDHEAADIAAIYSDDGGAHWTEPEIVIENHGDQNIMSVSLLRLQDGRLAMFYLIKNAIWDLLPVMRVSTDEGRSWSDWRTTVDMPGYSVVNNDRIVQLESGRLIIPVGWHRTKHRESPDAEIKGDGCSIAIWFYSDDGGETWHESEDWWALPLHTRSGFQEPGVVELDGGRVFSFLRTDTGCQWATWSEDGGVRWSPPKPTEFRSPQAPMSVKRMPGTDKLLALWADRSSKWGLPAPDKHSWDRTPLVSAMGDTRSATEWTNHKLVESDHTRGYAYTAIHFVEDPKPAVLLGYCAGGRETGSMLTTLRLRRTSPEWFLT